MAFHERCFYFMLLFLIDCVIGKNYTVCGVGLSTPGYTVPSGDITLEYGEDLDIICVLREDTGDNASSRMAISLENRPQPVEILNSTSIRLHVKKHPTTTSSLYICTYEKKLVCQNSVSVGTKPKNLEDFYCISTNYEKLTCNWTAPENYVKTEYNLSYTIPQRAARFSNPCPKLNSSDKDGKRVYNCYWALDTRPQYRHAHDKYTFSLGMSNMFGSTVKLFKFEHYKYVRPNAPENLSAHATSPHSVKLSWNISLHMQSFPPGLYHRIKLYSVEDGGKSGWNVTDIIRGFPHNKSIEYELKNLEYAHTVYDIRISMLSAFANESDENLWSPFSSVTVLTLSKLPDRPPRTNIGSFEVINNVNRTVYIRWQKIDPHIENGKNFSYFVEIIEQPEIYTRSRKNYAVFDNLRDVNYTFRVWSENEIGRSIGHSLVFVPSSRYAIKEPLSLVKWDKGGGDYYLAWESRNVQNIISYTLFWCTGTKDRPYPCDGNMNWTTVSNNILNYSLRLPENDKTYQFAVSANSHNASSGMLWAECTVIHIQGTAIGKMRQVYVKSTQPKSITIAWKLECANKMGSVNGYIISYCPTINDLENSSECKDEMQNKTIDGDSKTEEAVINNLKPFTAYKIQVKVRLSTHNESQYSDPIYNHTSETAPTSPRNLRVTNITNSSLILLWEKPIEENGVMRNYTLYLNGIQTDSVDYVKGQITYSKLLKNLSSYTDYDLRVKACTSQCSNAATLHVTTKIAAPGITDQKGGTWENTSFVITWETLKPLGGNLDFYQVKLSDSHHQNDATLVNVTDNKYIIENCADNPKYDVFYLTVRTVNIDEGRLLPGPWSKTQEYRCLLTKSQTWVYIIIILAIIVFFGMMVYLSKIFWIRLKIMKNLDAELPEGLKDDNNSNPEKRKHIENDDQNLPADELPMLKKPLSQSRTLSGDSSGLSSGNESVASSLHSEGGISTSDSGTEHPRSPSLSGSEHNKDVSLRQRTSVNKPPKTSGYVPIPEITQAPWAVKTPPPGGYSVIGVAPPVKKSEIAPGYMSLDVLQPKVPASYVQFNPSMQSPSDSPRPPPSGYVPYTPQEPADRNTDYVMAGIPSKEVLIPNLLEPRENRSSYVKIPPGMESFKTVPQFTWQQPSSETPKTGYVCVGDSIAPKTEMDVSSGKGYVPHHKFDAKSLKED